MQNTQSRLRKLLQKTSVVPRVSNMVRRRRSGSYWKACAAKPPSLPHAPGMRRVVAIAELCRREGIAQGVYYKWSKDFMEAGKRRLAGDTSRGANTDEVRDLRREARDLKEVVAEQMLEMRLLKKSMIGDGESEE